MVDASMADFQCDINQIAPIALNVSFRCKAGEVLAVVGPSGGGKTTLLRMIAGLSQPEQGNIQCGQQVWCDTEKRINMSPQQRHIGYMPQHYGLFPHLTALQNVMAGLDHLAKSERKARAEQWLERVNLQAYSGRLPEALSGGQKQRVALARALAREPAALLLDEPFSSLDRESRERLYLVMAKLKTQLSIPIIMVTHDIYEAQLLADNMILLSQGSMLQQGSPSDVLAKPKNEMVARQMGLRNIFSSKLMAYDQLTHQIQLQLGRHIITCRGDINIAAGSLKVSGELIKWVIPHYEVRFNAIQDHGAEHRQNELNVSIESLLPMGDVIQVVASVDGCDQTLSTQIPTHLANKLALAVGVQATVSLRPNKIHLLDA